jgi:hypothetical protein
MNQYNPAIEPNGSVVQPYRATIPQPVFNGESFGAINFSKIQSINARPMSSGMMAPPMPTSYQPPTTAFQSSISKPIEAKVDSPILEFDQPSTGMLPQGNTYRSVY